MPTPKPKPEPPRPPPIKIPAGCEATLTGEWQHEDDPTYRYHFEDDGSQVTVWVYRAFPPPDAGMPSRLFPRLIKDGGTTTADGGVRPPRRPRDGGLPLALDGGGKPAARTRDGGLVDTGDAGLKGPPRKAHPDGGSVDGPPAVRRVGESDAGIPDAGEADRDGGITAAHEARATAPGEAESRLLEASGLGRDGGRSNSIFGRGDAQDGGERLPGGTVLDSGVPLDAGEPDDGGLDGSVEAAHHHPLPADLLPQDGGSPPLATAVIHLRRTPNGFLGVAETLHLLPSGRECRATFATRISACSPTSLVLVSETSTPVGEGCQTPAVTRPAAMLEHRLARSAEPAL